MHNHEGGRLSFHVPKSPLHQPRGWLPDELLVWAFNWQVNWKTGSDRQDGGAAGQDQAGSRAQVARHRLWDLTSSSVKWGC